MYKIASEFMAFLFVCFLCHIFKELFVGKLVPNNLYISENSKSFCVFSILFPYIFMSAKSAQIYDIFIQSKQKCLE